MAITNGYATLAEFKAYKKITTDDLSRDAVIESIIEGASRDFDNETGRTFYARTETHYFDVPDGRELWLDDDLLTVTTLTNGDDSTLADSDGDYSLIPRNHAPYYAVRLGLMSGLIWELDSEGNPEDVIELAGTWGYSTTAPHNVRQAVLQIAELDYDSRFGDGGTQGAVSITAAGVVITPQSWPARAMRTAQSYKKIVG